MGARGRSILVAGAIIAGLVGVEGCSTRPLRSRDGAATISGGAGATGTGGAGASGTGCGVDGARMELIGSPLLVLDNPPVDGNLYTTLLWTGQEYLFVWRIYNGDGVLMQRIDASGQGVGGNLRVRAYENACDLAWGGSRLAAAWTRKKGATTDLMFQTFDGFGRPMIDAVLKIALAHIAYDRRHDREPLSAFMAAPRLYWTAFHGGTPLPVTMEVPWSAHGSNGRIVTAVVQHHPAVRPFSAIARSA